MSLLIDTQIRTLALEQGMLQPFIEGEQGNDIISRGLTSAGYDLRLGHTVKIFKNTFCRRIDPKAMKRDPEGVSKMFDVITGLKDGDQVVLPPAPSYILAYSLEYIRMPRHLKGRCVGKSTWARCGVIVNTTPIEPMWEGHLTIEIANVSPCEVVLYAGEGIAQLEFETLAGACEIDYEMKGGKYQRQGAEPVAAKVKE